MLRTLFAAAALAGTTALAACSSGPTPYQPASAAGAYERGYAETKIENDRYRISFKGNSLTDRETVENYLLYRAAELTLQSGYDTFTIVNRDTDKDSSIRRTGGYSRFSHMYFSPRWGWVHAWDPFWSSPARYDEVTRYETFAEIVMSRGEKSGNPNAFNAREVSQNLAAAIQRPAS